MINRKSINTTILVAASLLLLATTYLLQQTHVSETRFLLAASARDHSRAIQRSIDISDLIGESFLGFYASSREVTRDEFTAFSHVFVDRYPFIKAISWNPRVPGAERARFESIAAQASPEFEITERTPGGELVRAQERDEYYPVYFIEPLASNQRALGYDVASETLRRNALHYAGEHGRPSITGRIKLVQSTRDDWSFLMFFPVYPQGMQDGSRERMVGNVAGYIVIIFDIPSLIEQSLNYRNPAGLNFTVYDESAPEEERFLYYHKSRKLSAAAENAKQTNPDSRTNNTLEILDRRWAFVYEAIPGYFDTSLTREAKLVFLGGVAILLLLFAYFRLTEKRELELSRQHEKLERLVLERTQALRASNRDLESYSYSIAHDLRSPLRSIVGFTQIIEESAAAKLNDEEKDCLRRVVLAGKHMAQLLDDILELSRVSRSKLVRQLVDVSALCHEFATRLEHAGSCSHDVFWEIEEGMDALADPSLLSVAMENLLTNACKFSSREEVARITIGRLQENKEKIYFVRDNGVGFDMEHADNMFRAFHRLHPNDEFEGTGIGLATVQRIVERHGGRVWAESVPGQGATFFFTLGDVVP